MGPTLPTTATSNLLILRLPAVAVTAEVASSSLVVPAIIPKSCTNFNETNKGAKGGILAPLLHPFSFN